MKKILLIYFVLFSSNCIVAQRVNKDVICHADTFIIRGQVKVRDAGNKWIDSTYLYRAQLCQSRSIVGLRLDLGFAKYFYNEPTASWLGNHGGPVFNLSLAIKTLNFGVRFKPWTIHPLEELDFNGIPLPTQAELNPIKIDYYIGYSIDFKKNISLEPSLGYSSSIFKVINEDKLGQNYSLPGTGGMVCELTLNKYFNLQQYEYICIFGSFGYGFVDFKNVHASLDTGYYAWSIGLAFKDFFKKQYYRRID